MLNMEMEIKYMYPTEKSAWLFIPSYLYNFVLYCISQNLYMENSCHKWERNPTTDKICAEYMWLEHTGGSVEFLQTKDTKQAGKIGCLY
jgi:hypothetical protein